MEVREDEIVKALRCCADKGCKFCSEQGKPYCGETVASLAWDLIQRQKAEIERLQKANESFGEAGGKLVVAYKKVKSEARKEFWEQIKAMYGLDENDIIVAVNIKEIDNLLAEMEERV